MKNKRKLLIVTFALLMFATPAFAWMGGWQGYYGDNRPALSAEQQQQVQQLENRYGKELQELEAQLNTKQAELTQARADGSTTMAHYNALQAELGALENSYRAKLGQANQEVWQVTGTGTAPWFACDFPGCNHGNGRHGMMRGGMMMGNGMMGHGDGQYRSCCW